MFARPEEIVAAYAEKEDLRFSILDQVDLDPNRYYNIGGKIPEIPETITVEKARDFLKVLKDEYLEHAMGKGLRPWDVIDVCAGLDPNKTWIGIEYETGYHGEDYEKVVNYVWRNTLHSVIDNEGCGDYPCEITFAPVHVEDFLSNRYEMDRLLNWKKKKGIYQDREEDTGGPYWCENCHEYHDEGEGYKVGIHCNISTPSFRTHTHYHHIGNLLGWSVNNMTTAEKETLFNRIPYGSICPMENGRGHKYLEGKLFDTTGNLDNWAKYKEVIVRLADLTEYLSANWDELTGSKTLYNGSRIPNMFDILSGKSTPDEVDMSQLVTERKVAMNRFSSYPF